MRTRLFLVLLLALSFPLRANAQGVGQTAQPVTLGYMSITGCSSPALTPCFIPYGATLPTSGGGGGGGAITAASGSYASGALSVGSGTDGWNVTEGAKADSAYAGSGSASIVALLKGVYTGVTSPTPAGTNTIGGVTITAAPAAPTVGASQSITSLALKTSATSSTGGVQYFHAENATATAGYCVLYNATAAPSTGALTAGLVLAFQLLPASGYCDWVTRAPPIAASAGAVVLLTSAANPYTYTTGTITGSIYGLAQ